MDNKVTIGVGIKEIDRNVFAVFDSLNNYATQLIYDFNKMLEAELLQRVSVGALTRMKHQIERELLRREQANEH